MLYRYLVCGLLATQFGWSASRFPDPLTDLTASGKHKEIAVLAGGCFWGVEAVFESLRGVSDVVSGYAGGK